MSLALIINGTTLHVTLANNSSAEELKKKLSSGNVTINMKDYSNFEKVGDLGFSLPTNDEDIHTDFGDLILYEGHYFVIYYDKNHWNFTKIGKIQNISQNELKKLLGSGNVTVTLKLGSN
ncbi:hypothetical protein TVAG_465270 [Trichomonas vaginalis G3]|uniref:Cyclophilin-like domain-containing protein n=1 Tax=Trichomonas vaginalis (strain ATCC PRA-98 / G3) TaxID=412133 RepID=A2DTZ2_TRIV3|nr:FMN binding [Trichomonas vaginalis G3]EAY16139.1 hypothetical protein TVAG_465270 [Trichomonas vaginalis G3]KAI5510444.1 FMN binding [Trichomonas vaginalis G3]|eukprot:XP_001328362.1 hypothetical protein [Trichomonas vaginalis G3]